MAEMEGNKRTNKLLRYIGCIQNSEQSLDYIHRLRKGQLWGRHACIHIEYTWKAPL